MNFAIILLCLVVGAAIGALVTALYLQKRQGDVATQVGVLEAQLKSSQEQAGRALQEKERSFQVLMDQKVESMNEAMDRQKQVHEEAMRTLQEKFDEMTIRYTNEMKVATNDMLQQRQKEFSESSSMNLGNIVNPLRETIDEMKKVMAENTEKQTAMGGEMKANIENMMRQSEAAMKSADELNRTFKLGNRVQGDWGETILNELLESQGLTQGVHYDTQVSLRDADGKLIRSEDDKIMRPDVILHLDKRRDVVIDSKVSLTAYMDYANADNEADRKRFLKMHLDSLKKHVKELSTKDYSAYIRPPKARMSYVIMFVPHSAALWTALNAQPDLWRNAMDQNVFIADEQTLFAALRIINLTWTQIQQAQNHEKVYELANEMLDRVGKFMKNYQEIGTALEKATKSFNDGSKKLAPNGQSILTTAYKLQKLGAKQNDKNPLPGFADIDDVEQIEAQNPQE